MEKIFIKNDITYNVKVQYNSYWQGFYVVVERLNKGLHCYINLEDWEHRFPLDTPIEEKIKFKEKLIKETIPQDWIDEVKQMEIEKISKNNYKFY